MPLTRIAITSVVVVALGLFGCAAPLQQRVPSYPGYGQSGAKWSRDAAECDSWARAAAGSAGDSTVGAAAGGAVAGAAIGAALGAIAGAFVGAADSGAAIGAALGGASGGIQGAGGGAAAQDQRLLAAYANCMAARGYVVNGTMPQPATVSFQDAEASVARPTVEQRLLRLQQLHTDGLITDKEYRQRRRSVLDDI